MAIKIYKSGFSQRNLVIDKKKTKKAHFYYFFVVLDLNIKQPLNTNISLQIKYIT